MIQKRFVYGVFVLALAFSSGVRADSLIDPTAIDASVSPCDDFYQYACGNWIKNAVIPSDHPSLMRSFDSINDNNLKIENEILARYAAHNYTPKSTYAEKLGAFYSSCMNTDQIEKDAPAHLRADLVEVDGLKNKAQLGRFVSQLQLKGVDLFFGFGPDSDAKDSTKQIAEFSQGGMGLPNRTYYLEDANREVREKYVAYVAQMLKLSGYTEEASKTAAAKILSIETTLADAALPLADLYDPLKTYNPTDLAGVKGLLPHLDVDGFIAGMGLRDLKTINVTEPKFIKAVDGLLASTPLDDLKDYLKWHVIRSRASQLGDAYVKAWFAFNGTFLNGQKEITPRWKRCVRATESAMGEALGEAYVNATFGSDGKKKALEMIAGIRSAFRENLATVDWLDDATRKKAAEKLEKVLPKIGFPDRFRNYDSLVVGASYLSNTVNGRIFESRRQLRLIGKPVDKSLWEMYPQTVNAYYNPPWNEIVFPAGILQSPFFSKNANDAQNLGAIGMVMGHELTHGFDSSGRHYDADGNLVDWWTPAASASFDRKTQCMIDQFDHYEVVPGVFLKGKQTLTENIADLGGVKLAYHAFKKLTAGKPPAARVAGLTEAQQFFVSLGQIWCSKSTPEQLKLRAQTDPHSDPKHRINGSLVNTPAFGEAFGCEAGTPMVPKDHCSLW